MSSLKLFSLLAVADCKKEGFGYPSEREKSNIPEVRNECIERCEIVQLDCILECDGDMDCIRQCNRDIAICFENCMETTTPSSTSIETTISPSQNSVLVLSTYDPSNKPMVIDFNGNVNYEVTFDFNGLPVWYGCGVTFMDQFWYFGGNGLAVRQVSKIEDCKLARQADMPFNLELGSCKTFLEPDPKILLCFDYYEKQNCHTFDGKNYQATEASIYPHRNTLGLAKYNGKALTTGCYSTTADCSFKTELMDMTTLTWTDGPNYPFGSGYIAFYSTAETAEAAYIIGGYYTKDIIAQFKDGQWSQLDSLNQGRWAHVSLTIGDETIIIGGAQKGEAKTEVWKLENSVNKIINPALPSGNYMYGVGIYAVDFNFCK